MALWLGRQGLDVRSVGASRSAPRHRSGTYAPGLPGWGSCLSSPGRILARAVCRRRDGVPSAHCTGPPRLKQCAGSASDNCLPSAMDLVHNRVYRSASFGEIQLPTGMKCSPSGTASAYDGVPLSLAEDLTSRQQVARWRLLPKAKPFKAQGYPVRRRGGNLCFRQGDGKVQQWVPGAPPPARAMLCGADRARSPW
eukprot:jgi/Botrbrau1/17699/Bobra.0166s0123.1